MFSFGTALAAPIAILVARARARRRQRPLSRLASWIASMTGASIATVVVAGILFALAPAGTLARMDASADSARVERSAHPPAWVSRLRSMSGAPADPAIENVVRSRAAMHYFQLMGIIFVCVVFGSISGSLGWVGSQLLGYAFTKRASP